MKMELHEVRSLLSDPVILRAHYPLVSFRRKAEPIQISPTWPVESLNLVVMGEVLEAYVKDSGELIIRTIHGYLRFHWPRKSACH
ncbi:hypothetical protein BI364_13690 [Acidihalobacter yilgarnensis]|uniref:Uncharacterized protein n=1 Tax=Acidihalobacter yilgarnensis TaxID=2819280 RepID=A0A1D8IQV8_9GAMM|nr:hypothetical protein BI364_13690 [Acidihalobacter yilgarnensis]